MDEHGYIRSIHKKLPSGIFAWKINARFAGGVPDTWYSGTGGDLWVEYKYRPRTPTRRFAPGLSALQRNWLQKRHAEGRQVATIIGCPAGGYILAGDDWDHDKVVPPAAWLTARDIVEWLKAQTSSC